MDIYLIRHSRVDIAPGSCYGQLEVPLLHSCGNEFAGTLAKLPELETVWTSPLERCRSLAEHIAGANRRILVIDPRWSELDFGRWEGKLWKEISRKESDPWASDYWNVAPPEGETYRQLHERVNEALWDLTVQPAQRVAVVSHAGPIRAALAQCKGLQPDRYHKFALSNGSVTLLNWSEKGWRLKYLNR